MASGQKNLLVCDALEFRCSYIIVSARTLELLWFMNTKEMVGFI